MDTNAVLLENSSTLSTLTSELTEIGYSAPLSPIVSPSRKNEESPAKRHTPSKKRILKIRPPYLMICISIVEIAIRCLQEEDLLRKWLVYDPRQRVQAWRFGSYMFLHTNALHLALNVMIQLVIATPLEVEQSRLGVATIYFGGGICGSLGASLFQPSLYLMGASAGVYALLTSHLAHLYLCRGELQYVNWRLSAILLLAGADVISLPLPVLLGCGKIGWAAHVAGALAGPLLGLAAFPKQSKKGVREKTFVRFLRFVSAVSVLLLIVGGILGNVYLISLPETQGQS
ncbi:hypothetical protein KM043_015691 [Ampulex compressa]|nr:hypothetical protein KM043_015691 [Ampulex compressa]